MSLKAIILVFFAFAAASIISHQSGFDHWFTAKVYQWEGGNGGGFPWRENFWLANMIHDGGRTLVKRLFFICLALWLLSGVIAQLRPYRRAFLFVLLATLLSTGLISFLKHHTTIPCPQALVEFGGREHWVNIWQLFSPGLPVGACYPAGHASGGYTWLCLAFLFPFASRQFYWALLPGVILGLIFGLAQQLRGAHFLSHDLLTIALCWLIPGMLYHLMRCNRSLWLARRVGDDCAVVQNMS